MLLLIAQNKNKKCGGLAELDVDGGAEMLLGAVLKPVGIQRVLVRGSQDCAHPESLPFWER